MKKRTLWIAALAGLLAIGVAGQALAGEVEQARRARFSCGAVAGDPLTVQGTVTAQEWNRLEVQTDGKSYTVVTGPYKAGSGLPDLDGQAVTVEGYAGAGTNCNSDQATDIIRARTITYAAGTIDLTGVPEGGFGQWRRGDCAGTCLQDGEGEGNQVRGGRGNGIRSGGGRGGNCPR